MPAEVATSPELHAIKNLKQIAREEFIAPGTSVCGGCGGLAALRLAAKVLGSKTIFINAAGCFTLLAVFPYTPFKGSWLYTTMASAAAGAQGGYAMRSMCSWRVARWPQRTTWRLWSSPETAVRTTWDSR